MNWSDLHATAFVLKIRPGMTAEYRRRHDEIWPEMQAALLRSGIVHYAIYLDEAGGQVFGQMLRTRPAPGTDEPVILRWRAYMADVLEMDGDMPRRLPIERVFLLTADQSKGSL
jgi:L-rhamnose mutarotase